MTNAIILAALGTQEILIILLAILLLFGGKKIPIINIMLSGAYEAA